MKQYRWFILIFSVLLVLAVWGQYNKPKSIIWSPSFSSVDKIPFGALVVHDMLADIFPGCRVERVYTDAYRKLYQDDAYGNRERYNYIFINSSFQPDHFGAQRLLDFAAKGSSVFIAAENISELLLDSLHIDMRVAVPGAEFILPQTTTGATWSSSTHGNVPPVRQEDSAAQAAEERDTAAVPQTDSPTSATTIPFPGSEQRLNFSNPALRSDTGYVYRKVYLSRYFGKVEQLHSTTALVLGTDEQGRPNFLKIFYGEGAFYLNTQPYAFTNYYALNAATSEYISKALSYLPLHTVWWDDYYKDGRREIRSPLRYVLSQRSLKWAVYTLLFTVLLFVVFRSKRTQRIIPVIKAPVNATLEFVRTVGRLYYHHGNHGDLAEKKIRYFLEYLRSHFHIPTGRLDDDFRRHVAQKTGIPRDRVEALFTYIQLVQRKRAVSAEELANLNTMIDSFYRESAV